MGLVYEILISSGSTPCFNQKLTLRKSQLNVKESLELLKKTTQRWNKRWLKYKESTVVFFCPKGLLVRVLSRQWLFHGFPDSRIVQQRLSLYTLKGSYRSGWVRRGGPMPYAIAHFTLRGRSPCVKSLPTRWVTCSQIPQCNHYQNRLLK